MPPSATSRRSDAGERIVVGVNAHVKLDEDPPIILRVDPSVEARQTERLAAVRARRDPVEVERTLAALAAAAESGANLMPSLVECARAYASVGEMCNVLRAAFGLYRETPVF